MVLQSYRNNSYETMEAKYVFPLDQSAAVCGFEAFINDKHVVGVVKEKEKAHREYRQAVEAGHGAYLMDEEFPVSYLFIVVLLILTIVILIWEAKIIPTCLAKAELLRTQLQRVRAACMECVPGSLTLSTARDRSA